ncbi:short-chain dehydrogenase [[Pantoea] beijingensis]|uniref:Short-chain dehydrogenase n=1 Tax=[Pantoea] beijingensis TaxID=1324864 RepID=A0A443IJ03_9GAMM|nr:MULTISPECIES: oxidoreductase [Erwiniaceae]RWR03936.1 short-chain dehydrogenase [[Pantoea] beijingensis]
MSSSQKVWFITGVSRGFGHALAQTLLAQGETVIGTTRDIAPSFISEPHFHWLPLDVTDAGGVSATVEKAFAVAGRIDVLVNNAGYGLLGAVEEATDEQIDRLFAVNFHGTRRVIQAALPRLRKQRSGHIINISSIAGIAPNSGSGLYSAAKFAVEGMSQALAQEVAPLGIHVTLVEPGAFRTDFLSAHSLRRSSSDIEDYATTAGAIMAKLDSVAGKQLGDPQKAAEAIVAVARAENPPLHLLLGSDALARTEKMLNAFREDIDTWRAVTLGTDFNA